MFSAYEPLEMTIQEIGQIRNKFLLTEIIPPKKKNKNLIK